MKNTPKLPTLKKWRNRNNEKLWQALASKFDYVDEKRVNADLVPVKTGRAWGLARLSTAETIVEPKYEEIGFINDKIFSAKENGKWIVFETKTGQPTSTVGFDDVKLVYVPDMNSAHYKTNYVKVKINKKWGVYDLDRKEMVLPAEFIRIESFNLDGHAKVWTAGTNNVSEKCGLVNNRFEVLLNPVFDDILSTDTFSIENPEIGTHGKQNNVFVVQDGLFWEINLDNYIILSTFANEQNQSDTVANSTTNSNFSIKQAGKLNPETGLIDPLFVNGKLVTKHKVALMKDGKMLTERIFDRIDSFSNDRVIVSLNGYSCLVDNNTGEVVIGPRSDNEHYSLTSFNKLSDSLLVAKNENGGSFIFDTDGNFLFGGSFKSISYVEETGLFTIKHTDGKFDTENIYHIFEDSKDDEEYIEQMIYCSPEFFRFIPEILYCDLAFIKRLCRAVEKKQKIMIENAKSQEELNRIEIIINKQKSIIDIKLKKIVMKQTSSSSDPNSRD